MRDLRRRTGSGSVSSQRCEQRGKAGVADKVADSARVGTEAISSDLRFPVDQARLSVPAGVVNPQLPSVGAFEAVRNAAERVANSVDCGSQSIQYCHHEVAPVRSFALGRLA